MKQCLLVAQAFRFCSGSKEWSSREKSNKFERKPEKDAEVLDFFTATAKNEVYHP